MGIDGLSPDKKAALRLMLEQELAQRDLLAFAERVYPKFQAPPHIKLLAGLLEQIERGEIRRLCVSLPVRHGKSVICSQIFPAWHIGNNPTSRVILASHSESLAVDHSREAKRIVEDPTKWPFPDVKMSEDSAAVGRWNVEPGRGGLYAIGVGGSITGRGANLLLIDDALHDGLSVAERESAWKWYTEVAVPRLEPNGAIVVVGARFAIDDIPGRLRDAEDAGKWVFVNIPAIADERDPLERKPGEALWPERVSLAELEERRVTMRYAFEAQFQQNPMPEGGLMFDPKWFEQRYDQLPDKCIVPPQPSGFSVMERMVGGMGKPVTASGAIVIQAIDSAWKTAVYNDRSAIATLVSDMRDIYIADVWCDRVPYTKLKPIVEQKYEQFNPRTVFIEEAASGLALIPELQMETRLPIVGIKPGRDSKEARAEAVTGWFQSGRVKFPKSAPWLRETLDEFCRFPHHPQKRDDIVDAIVLGVAQMQALITRIQAEAKFSQISRQTASFMQR